MTTTRGAVVERLPPSAEAVVLAHYEDTFENVFYRTAIDDGRVLKTPAAEDASSSSSSTPRDRVVNDVCRVATLVSRAVARRAGATAVAASSLLANCSLVDALLTCALDDAACALARETLPDTFVGVPATTRVRPTHYAGVWAPRNTEANVFPALIRDVLARRLVVGAPRGRCGRAATGPSVCAAAERCVAGACVLARVYYHDARVRGVDYDAATRTYALSPAATAANTFLEPNWGNGAIRARLYVEGSPAADAVVAALGVVVATSACLAARRLRAIVDSWM